MRTPSFFSFFVLLPLLAACGDDDGTCPECAGDAGGPDGAVAVDASVTPDAGPACAPGEPTPEPWDCAADPGIVLGEPIVADPMSWTWVPFDDAFCMDGSTTGIGINPNPDSNRLLILLEGGGACFDGLSCLGVSNPDGYGEAKLANAAGGFLQNGITDRSDADNPVADWNIVYVPYCSGDAHSGTNPEGFDGRMQVGHLNYEAFIARIAATFDSVEEVVLAGRSAGGLGTIVNYQVTASAFGCTPVHVLNDSGALLPDEYLRPCLQSKVRDVWGVAVPGECTRCSCDDGGGLVNALPYLARAYPDRRFGLASYTADGTFRQFFSYGYSSGCNLPTTMPPEDFEAGLVDVRTMLEPDTTFRTFFVAGSAHTFTFDDLSASSAGGVTLAGWLGQLIDGDPAWADVGP